MLKLLKASLLAAGAAAAFGCTLSAPAHADDFALTVSDHGPRIQLYLGDDDDERGPPPPPRRGGWDRYDDDDDDWDRGPGWRRPPPPPPPACSPRQALAKAARMGLRRARVVDVDRRTIDVAGRRYGERYVVTFARVPFCPVIR